MNAPRPGRCLGDRIADLADGRLDPAAMERAYAHVAVCPACRAALEAQREVRARLAQPGVDPLEAPSDLLARLRGLGVAPLTPTGYGDAADAADAAIPVQAGVGRVPAGAAGVRPGVIVTGTHPSRVRRRHRRRIAVASAAGAAAMAVVAVVGGGSSAVSGPVRSGPSIAPVVDRLTAAHATSTDQMPFSGPRMVTAALTGPAGSTARRP